MAKGTSDKSVGLSGDEVSDVVRVLARSIRYAMDAQSVYRRRQLRREFEAFLKTHPLVTAEDMTMYRQYIRRGSILD